MRYGIVTANLGDYADLRVVVRLARVVEAAGWETFFVWDHLGFVRGVPSGSPGLSCPRLRPPPRTLCWGSPSPRWRVAARRSWPTRWRAWTSLALGARSSEPGSGECRRSSPPSATRATGSSAPQCSMRGSRYWMGSGRARRLLTAGNTTPSRVLLSPWRRCPFSVRAYQSGSGRRGRARLTPRRPLGRMARARHKPRRGLDRDQEP